MDVDTGYGQLLRRIDLQESGVRYALVVPASMRDHVTRVRKGVRACVGIELYVVEDDGEVSLVRD